MFWKGLITKFIDNVDTKLQAKPKSIQQATPRTIACFLIGYQMYYRFIDHQVRKKLSIQNKSQKVYTDLLVNSQNSSTFIQRTLVGGSFLSSLYASYETKNKLWLLGGSIMIGVTIFDYFFVKSIKNDLERLKSEENFKLTQKQMMQNTQKRLSLIQKWKSKYNYKIAIGILAILVFYIAELGQSQKVNLKFNYKK